MNGPDDRFTIPLQPYHRYTFARIMRQREMTHAKSPDAADRGISLRWMENQGHFLAEEGLDREDAKTVLREMIALGHAAPLGTVTKGFPELEVVGLTDAGRVWLAAEQARLRHQPVEG